jgi:hypothetical protein
MDMGMDTNVNACIVMTQCIHMDKYNVYSHI